MRLELENVGKRYGSRWGVRGVNAVLEPGIVGLLGPNGAGKTTLMRMLATVTRPSEGAIRWDGVDVATRPDAIRSVLGFLPQDFGVYPRLSAIEFLEYLAAVKGLAGPAVGRRILALLEAVNLTEARRRPVGSYSGGMRQRLGIAQALLNDPRLLIVDEPTAGLDPEERVRFRHLLADLAGERIVLLSTHVVSDVESVADRIALLVGGRLLGCGPADGLRATAAGRVWEWTAPAEALPDLRRRVRLSGVVRSDGALRVRALAERAPDPAALAVEPTLEDAYLLQVGAADGAAAAAAGGAAAR